MAANTTIIVADSQPTPVNHTFTPIKIDGEIAYWTNFAQSSAIGREQLSLKLTNTGAVRKVVVNLKMPRLITETINGVSVPSVPDFGMVKAELFVPETWTPEAAEDIIEMFANLFKNSTLIAMGNRGEFVY